MILYLDASALVKRYVAERGSEAVARSLEEAEYVATSVVTRVEVSSALGRAVRVDALAEDEAASALRLFRSEWARFLRIQAAESVIAAAARLAWDLGLRAYDTVQLASALWWSDTLEAEVTFATFDLPLWQAAGARGLTRSPPDLPATLERWRRER
ncbi:MAG: PIN domain-containing protein [Gemmatimonadetes bacterium]|nr:type II toxin-antitoxin system VapC family toxin [Gemmatimonadota bacterium]NIR77387.1 type II toxin-antitoxin system VapC family toxin [Gemmatimonadota bacterium]NIT85897.1 type II toxin-antitoxin system VapC family toxin [Gemmatimonadota bacterium]NIU29723.1 type II toxin-antitoxin system VapC family toxin [Gemmatimonadota bacterium]NIU34765.1 PIN domain-containing protein [Gemmatimonadota bacterium]